MRIAIVGAGAIGAWLGVRLANAGFEVSVLARGQTLADIKQHGLRLVVDGKTRVASVNVSDRAAELGAHDLVIVAVKGQALSSVAPAVSVLMGAHGTVHRRAGMFDSQERQWIDCRRAGWKRDPR